MLCLTTLFNYINKYDCDTTECNILIYYSINKERKIGSLKDIEKLQNCKITAKEDDCILSLRWSKVSQWRSQKTDGAEHNSQQLV